MMPRDDKNTSVFVDGDLSHAESRRGGEFFSRKERIDRKGWKRVRLGEICKLCRGVRVVRNQLSQGHYLVYQNSLIPLGLYDKCNTPANTTFVIAAGSAGEIGYCENPFWAADDCFFLLPNKNVISKFLYYSLVAQQQHISGLVRRGSVPRLARDIVGNLLLLLPDIAKQKKIVKALTSIDINISVLQSLIAKYEVIKKATVNLLLKPKTGWRRVKLGDVTETSSGGTPSRNEDSYYQGSIPWFTTSELCDESLYDSKEHISQEALQNSSAKIFPKGTLLLAMYGATIGKLGVLTKPAATNQACCAIKCGSDVETAFLFQVLYSRRQEIIALGCGAGQPNISQQIIKNLDLVLPPLPEQRKIAAQIAAIHKVLNDCKKQLDKAKNLKQGMMSYFFG